MMSGNMTQKAQGASLDALSRTADDINLAVPTNYLGSNTRPKSNLGIKGCPVWV